MKWLWTLDQTPSFVTAYFENFVAEEEGMNSTKHRDICDSRNICDDLPDRIFEFATNSL